MRSCLSLKNKSFAGMRNPEKVNAFRLFTGHFIRMRQIMHVT